MTKRMLIDATHAEETRVVVLDGSRLEDFDVETSTKRQLKGNIYLAKVVRVEPSLQAAFVEYGGNRHGFLAFSEIHPDYYQIPVADRQRLIEAQAEEARLEEEEEDRAAEAAASEDAAGDGADVAEPPMAVAVAPEEPSGSSEPEPPTGPSHEDPPQRLAAQAAAVSAEVIADAAPPSEFATETPDAPSPEAAVRADQELPAADDVVAPAGDPAPVTEPAPLNAAASESEPALVSETASITEAAREVEPAPVGDPVAPIEPVAISDPVVAIEPVAMTEPVATIASVSEADSSTAATAGDDAEVSPLLADADDAGADSAVLIDAIPEQPPPETLGGDGDSAEEARERRMPPRFMRNYKIQEVIKRRQILLVQVVKEERGTKGAALTTYLSLAGRFGVLMPNSPRGGGISRKITSATDRRRLKEIMAELDIPKGMGLIVRTAGANRPKAEIKRDCEYLLRLWDDIREHTLKSVAPALIYEEASLIKRAIRDVYSRDIDEIQVDGEQGWRAAHEFMRMLMPSHAKKVQLWKNGGQPLFVRHQVEAQLDAMLSPTVQLRSGGYLVINQAEALVAIDVNSGRSTRERGIEETALRTNLEAADEVARQLRLRDLAGLIVIDFIDMETRKHNAMVEKRLKEALKNDRARIQLGHISHFGLMEMSRQRLRPSLAETSFIMCSHCGGTGHVRSTESAAIHVLRGIEEEGAKRRAAEIVVYMAPQVALYVLNHKRERLADVEQRYGMRVMCLGEDGQTASQFRIERLRAQVPAEAPAAITPDAELPAAEIDEIDERVAEEPVVEAAAAEATAGEDMEDETVQADGGETQEEAEHRHRRRRRRRRSGRREDGTPEAATTETPAVEAADAEPMEPDAEGAPEQAEAGEEDHRARRRGRRGGRRRRHDGNGEVPSLAEPGAEQPDLPPVYAGPTPANPFGDHAFDIFDVLERSEEPVSPAVAPVSRAVEPEPAMEPAAVAEAGIIEPQPAPLAAAESAAWSEPTPSSPSALVESPLTEPASEPIDASHAEPPPEPVQSAPALESQVPEPPPEPELEPVPEPELEPAIAANDAAPNPAIQPIIIGGDQDVVVEKKRGWWRR